MVAEKRMKVGTFYYYLRITLEKFLNKAYNNENDKGIRSRIINRITKK